MLQCEGSSFYFEGRSPLREHPILVAIASAEGVVADMVVPEFVSPPSAEGVVADVVVPEFVSPSLGIFDAVRAGFF